MLLKRERKPVQKPPKLPRTGGVFIWAVQRWYFGDEAKAQSMKTGAALAAEAGTPWAQLGRFRRVSEPLRGARPVCGSQAASGRLSGVAAKRFLLAAHAPKARFFAPVLIAAKPRKPCDGAVFGAFYLLPQKERFAPGQGVSCGGFALPCACRAHRLQSLAEWAAAAIKNMAKYPLRTACEPFAGGFLLSGGFTQSFPSCCFIWKKMP